MPWYRSKRVVITVSILMGGLLILYGGAVSRDYNYTDMLDTIADGESSDNYNAYYGRPGNSSIDFTSMTIAEVLQWQEDYVEEGSPSSAVGRYQFIRPTLQGLIDEHNVDTDLPFTAEVQDKLAIELIKRRGVYDFMDGKISREDFAHNLSQEWAALPSVKGDNPEESYYADDGLNEARLDIAEIYHSMETLDNTE